jgi:curli biogenesis system outer membrane secretion channel CsgG
MRASIRVVAIAIVAALALPAVTAAQGKIRIAIWDFENHSERTWWGYEKLGPAARDQIDTAFAEDDKLSEIFSVIEREKLDMVMKEQGLSTSGALDQQTAAKVGKILGIKYILTGAIDKFSINTTKGGFGGIGGKYTKAEAKISMRFIDTTTAERLVSLSGKGSAKKGGVRVNSVNLSQDAEWGIASEAVEKASAEIVKKFAKGDKYIKKFKAGGVMGGGEGKIIKVEGNRAWINMGSMSGVKNGDQYKIVELGEALVDPDTGQVLGQGETTTGSGKIVEVQERFSIMEFTGSAKAKARVKKK